jgi:hypothetical protein
MAVAGYADEDQLHVSGSHTVDLLDQLVGIEPSDGVLDSRGIPSARDSIGLHERSAWIEAYGTMQGVKGAGSSIE